MINIEVEYKVMINKDDFELLLDKFLGHPFKLLIQTNYYYDTKNNKINKNKLSLRIRHIENEDKYILTLKEKCNEGNKEYEYYVNGINDITFTNQINDRLAKYNIYKDDLINTGSLQTYRLEIKYKKGVLFFDYNLYNNQKDYELEYEAENMNYAKKVVIELLNEYAIKYKESPLSKQARAIKKG